MPIKNGHGRRHVTALKMGKLPIFNLQRSKFEVLPGVSMPAIK